MALHSAGAGGGTVTATYTGAYTSGEVEIGGEKLMLLSLTGSGTLTFDAATTARIWMCDGGMAGAAGTHSTYSMCGGRGGSFLPDTTVAVGTTPITVTIGSGGANTTGDMSGGKTKFGKYATTTNGSGGGSGQRGSLTTGGGVSTVPFLATDVFDPHCAGGAGGGRWSMSSNQNVCFRGGNGGTNGGNGGGTTSTGYGGDYSGGTGGVLGGGNGGKYGPGVGSNNTNTANGEYGSYYGAAGGGAGRNAGSGQETNYTAAGKGYQGVVYVLYKTKKPKPFAFTYSGDYTDTIIDVNGTPKRLLTFLSSGVLTLDRETSARIWLCNGGYNGVTGSQNNGGIGGKFLPAQDVTIGKNTTVTIGAAGNGATSFGDLVATTRGSGAGAGARSTQSIDGQSAKIGGGVSTIPFGDTANFDKHCAGGAGGMCQYGGDLTDADEYGGNGGSNGGNGGDWSTSTAGTRTGGVKGGASVTSYSYNTKPNNATFYGSGGAGGGQYRYLEPGAHSSLATWSSGNPSSGYQGVVYVLMDAA